MWGKSKQKPVANIHFDTLIAESTLLRGNVEFSGGLHIDGVIKGNIQAIEEKSAVVRLSEAARVEGDVIAPHVIINGQVHGDVYASEHLELAENASITGNVYYNLIEMVMGAEVNGSLVHDKDQAVKKLGLSGERVKGSEKPLASFPSTTGSKADGLKEIAAVKPGSVALESNS